MGKLRQKNLLKTNSQLTCYQSHKHHCNLYTETPHLYLFTFVDVASVVVVDAVAIVLRIQSG